MADDDGGITETSPRAADYFRANFKLPLPAYSHGVVSILCVKLFYLEC
jgi:hypothetical protein